MKPLVVACFALVAACRGVAMLDPDPTKGEVILPGAGGWDARLILDTGDVGIWTVRAIDVFEQYAVPEIVGLDDLGRCHVLTSYSGKWTDRPRIHDGRWLGGLAHADIDPRVAGHELYTGGQSGNLYQLASYADGALDGRLIAQLPGHEIHTILAGELDPGSDVAELLLFTRPGGLYRVTPTGMHGAFETERVCQLPGRVRDAVLLPPEASGPPRMATVSRDGVLRVLWFEEGRPQSIDVHAEPMGMGRIALRRDGGAGPLVLYTTLDDGRVQRHERSGESWSAWETETIHAGPQGLRGIVSGRFHSDPSTEAVAIFGYSAQVRILSRSPDDTWAAETIFTDRDRGHWLTASELDGRNATEEIVGSGYGGRIFVLARPPGDGL